MSLEPWLLDLLVCPKTKVPLRLLSPAAVLALNEMIADGTLYFANGLPVEYPMDEALVTFDRDSIYAIRDSSPVLMEIERIPGKQASDLPDLH